MYCERSFKLFFFIKLDTIMNEFVDIFVFFEFKINLFLFMY